MPAEPPVPPAAPPVARPSAPVVGIVLAAGGSSRMGRPKALLPLEGRPLLLHQLDALAGACQALVVVLGAEATRIAAVLPPGLRWVNNADWAATGPRESLLLALEALALPETTAVFVTPVDVPPPPPPLLQALLQHGPPVVPAWRGQDGHPVLATAGALRRGLQGGTLRDAMHAAPRLPVELPDLVRNLNAPQDWADWCSARAGEGRG